MSTARSPEVVHIASSDDDDDDNKKLPALTKEQLERKRKRDETLANNQKGMDAMFRVKNVKNKTSKKEEDKSLASLLKLRIPVKPPLL